MRHEPATTALLVHHQSASMAQLAPVLRTLGFRLNEVTESEVRKELSRHSAPDVIFTDAEADWKAVLQLVQDSPNPTSVIVVSRLEDLGLYLTTLDHGAFDFITPPFGERQVAAVASQARVQTIEHRRRWFEGVLRQLPAVVKMAPQLDNNQRKPGQGYVRAKA